MSVIWKSQPMFLFLFIQIKNLNNLNPQIYKKIFLNNRGDNILHYYVEKHMEKIFFQIKIPATEEDNKLIEGKP